jgi:hypothetical protein
MSRGECINGPRPCPWTSCRHHLADVGGRTPIADPAELRDTCALDVADRGTLSQAEIAHHMRCTKQRVQQIEASALRKLKVLLG